MYINTYIYGPARHPISLAAAKQPIAVARAHGRRESHEQERMLRSCCSGPFQNLPPRAINLLRGGFFLGQNVNITPHPHHHHGTNSHEAEKQYTENGDKQ